MRTQQKVFDLLSDYVQFSKGGNNSYAAKKDSATITIHTNGNMQVQGKNKDKIEQEIYHAIKRIYQMINNYL